MYNDMRAIFFLIMFSVFGLMNYYVSLRGWQVLSTFGILKFVIPILIISMFVAFMSTMMFGAKMPVGIAKAVSFFGNTYVVVLIYLLLSFMVVDVVRLLNMVFPFLENGMLAFRFYSLVVSAIAISIALVVGNYKFNHPQVVKLNISLEKPKQHKNLRIVAVSDVHLGFSIDKKRLQSYVKLINDQQPDIVLLAGDISDRPVSPIVRQNMKEELSSITTKYGVYAINGNHEYMAEEPLAMTPYLKEAGIKVLRDNVVMVDSSFYIVGRDDKMNPNRSSVAELVMGLDVGLPKIMMDHQPFHLEEAEKNGVDLQISGHTHNGQFFPGNLIVKWMYELGYGYKKKGNTHYYVSSGLGIWGPQYRIGTQSEIVLIELEY
jgi:predicted MPP superfamily phosphohydrolase